MVKTPTRKHKPEQKRSVAARSRAKATKKPATRKPAVATRRTNVASSIRTLERRILREKQRLAVLRRKLPPQPVPDYTFKAHDGSDITLSQMFGSKNDLILIHNMGKGCGYCTLWADGFTGFTRHLEDRAGFVVISKDPIEAQRMCYRNRGWNFRMYSSSGSSFNRDMGYENDKGGQLPGVSAFHKDSSGQIFRTGTTSFGPGDDFCAVWPLLDLLKDGPNGWTPKYRY